MADKTRRWPNNVPGTYYVDQGCIDCNLCSEIAPDNFAVDADNGHDYVYMQPVTEEELSLCVEAMESCPVEAIGDDG
jgi:ferredoxin